MAEQVPKDISCLNMGGNSYLFYISANNRGRLQYYQTNPKAKGTEKQQDQGGYDYKNEETGITHQPLPQESGDVYVYASDTSGAALAAMAYRHNGTDEIRLYYKDSGNYLKELCHSGTNMDDDWYYGKLNEKKIRLDNNSKLSCDADGEVQVLRVYYSPPGSPVNVAFIGFGASEWTTRPLLLG